MTTFTPISALIGGGLIGLAAVLLMLLNGRIAGISGIASGILVPAQGDTAWRVAFVAGLVLAPLLYSAFGGTAAITMQASTPMLVAAGLLVGLGVKIGGGCTSGHGVCGVARWSRRSIMATGTFLATGFLTVFVVRHVLGI